MFNFPADKLLWFFFSSIKNPLQRGFLLSHYHLNMREFLALSFFINKKVNLQWKVHKQRLDSPQLHQGVPDNVSALTPGLFVYAFLPCLFCLFLCLFLCFPFFFSPQKFNQNASFKATSQFLIGHCYQFSVRILSCHSAGPGSITGQCIYF